MEKRKNGRGLGGMVEERKRASWKSGRKEEGQVERLKKGKGLGIRKGRGLGGKYKERKRARWDG